jgi:hypothetical protein
MLSINELSISMFSQPKRCISHLCVVSSTCSTSWNTRCQVLTLYICVALVDNHGEVMWCFSDQTSQTDFLEAPVSNQWSLFHVSNLCPISSRSVLGVNTEYVSGIT